MVDEAGGDEREDFISEIIDLCGLIPAEERAVAVRNRIREVVDKLQADADKWERHFRIESDALEGEKKKVNQSNSVLAAMHPDNWSAFSIHGHSRVCQDVEKLWDEVVKKIEITHRTESHFEVEVKESEREAKAQAAG